MRIRKYLLKFLLILVSCSCSVNEKSDTSAEIPQKNSEINSSNKKELNAEQVGSIITRKWLVKTPRYSNNFIKFEHLPDTIKNTEDKFIIEFQKDGNLSFKNMTNNYVCANGIPFFDKGTWEFRTGKYNPEKNAYELTTNLILHIKGGAMLESSFEFKREYSLKSINEDEFEIEKTRSLLEKYINYGNNFFEN